MSAADREPTIAFALRRARTGHGSRARHAGQRRANTWLAVFLVVVVAVSPIPFGSNRPAFWALSAAAIALAGLVYAIRLARLHATLRFPLQRIIPLAGLYAVFTAFIFIQVLPIGSFSFAGHGGDEIVRMPTLSIAPGETALMLLRQLGYGLFFFLVLQVAANRQRAEDLLGAIFAVVTAHAVYAMIALTQLGDPLLFFQKTAYRGSATGTFINRNSFATFVAIGVVVGASLLLARLRAGLRQGSPGRPLSGEGPLLAVLAVALAIDIGTVIATRSRMGTFSMCGGLMMACVIQGLGARLPLMRVLGIAAGALAAGGAAFGVLFGGGLFERLGSVQDSFGVRLSLYRQAMEMALARPLSGFGGGSFDIAYPLFHRPPVNPDLVWDKAHSTYLTLWVELGFVFGSIPLVILALLAIMITVQLVRGGDGRRPMGTAALGALTVVGVHSLMDFSLEIQANTYLMLAVGALGIAGWRGQRP